MVSFSERAIAYSFAQIFILGLTLPLENRQPNALFVTTKHLKEHYKFPNWI